MKQQELLIEDCFQFIRNGVSVKQNPDSGGLPITRIETISKAVVNPNRVGYADIQDSNLGKYEDYILQNGDILMSHINSMKYLGKSAIYEDNPVKLIHGMNLLCLRPVSDKCFPKYLNYFFSSGQFKNQLPKISNQSVNQASFPAGKLKKLKINLPPLETQKRIAQILDDAAALRDKTAQLLKEYDLLAQSIFLDMFGDPRINENNYKRNTLEEVLDMITYGLTVRPNYIDNGIRLISAREIRTGKINLLSGPQISYEDYKNLSEKGKPRKGEILFSKTGSIGHCAIIDTDEKFAITQNAARLVFKKSINPIFALEQMRSYYFQSLCQQRAKGNAVKDLQLGDMKKLPFLTPPIKLQNQFAEKTALIEQQKTLVKQEQKEAEDLFNCLLQKAFKGELV